MLSHAGAGETLFNVSHAQLKEVVENAVGGPVDSFAIIGSENINGFQGHAAEKVLPIIEYRRADGSTGRVTLFVKRMYGLEIAESRQYQFLKKRNIPVPRIHGEAIGSKNEEILFFERLDAIGIEEDNPEEVRGYIALLARINAIRPDESDPWKPPPHVVAADLADGKLIPPLLQDAWQHALTGDLGEDIHNICAQSRSRLPELSETSIKIGELLNTLPRALLYEDYAPRNTGWRNGRREFVAFDVHRLSIGPRFWDLCGSVGSRAEPLFKSVGWSDLVLHYLGALERYRGPPATLADFEREFALISAAIAFHSFSWLIRMTLSGRVDWTPDREEGRRFFRKYMLTMLETALLYKLDTPATLH